MFASVETFSDNVAAFDGQAFRLTACCGAAVTGVSVTAANPSGIACKGCYAAVDSALAISWDVDDANAWARFAGSLGLDVWCSHGVSMLWECPDAIAAHSWLPLWAAAERG